MSNRGLIRGAQLRNIPEGEWQPYGPNEGLPVLDASITTPNLGSGAIVTARWCRIGDTIFAYTFVTWGTGGNAGSGVYYTLMPPVRPAIPYFNATPTGQIGFGQTIGWSAMAGDSIGVQHMENCSVSWAGNSGVTSTASRIPAVRSATMNPHRWNRHGTATVAAGGLGLLSVTHNLGVTPDIVKLTPASNLRLSGMTGFQAGSLTSSTFIISVQAGGRTVADAVTTNTSAQVTSATAGFTQGDVSKNIDVPNIAKPTIISTVTNATTVQMNNTASASGSGLTMNIGGTSAGTLFGTQDFFWEALGPDNGTNGAGIFLTDGFPWTWGVAGQNLETRMVYPAEVAGG